MNTQQNQETNPAAAYPPLSEGLGGWISVGDSLPEYDINVFVAMPGGVSVGAISDEGEGWMWAVADYIGGDLASAECMCDDDYSSITHWMPIPKLPNVDLIAGERHEEKP